MSSNIRGVTLIIVASLITYISTLKLPNTSGIDGQLTANLGVDHFFSLWLVFNNEEVQMSDEPFTILAPRNSASSRDEGVLQQPELVKKLLLDHIVLGQRIDLTNLTEEMKFRTLGNREVIVRKLKEGNKLQANGATIIEPKVIVPNGLLVVIDNYLFPDDQIIKRNTTQGKLDIGMLSVVNVNKEEAKTASIETAPTNTSFVENIMQVLSFLKSGVRVFQHFLSRSNVSHLLIEGEDYTVFVPTDHAFQRWHPIDWGFYPFSVPEFTESVIINHFVKGRLKQEDITNGLVAKTLGGRDVVFRKTPTLNVNGAVIVKGDTPVTNGNIMFIGEVLFVSESVVSRLHQQHRDKETPPLLAFPWFGAQFLSHAFLALERDRRFTHITRFLNLADLAPHVSGTGYTFFVPIDSAFEELNLDKMPDNYLSTGDGLQILLNHFVKGRLYDKDLKNNTQLQTLGYKTINVTRKKDKVYINEATIVESEVFVYNLGTMFYIDKILFANKESLATITNKQLKTTTTSTEKTTIINEETDGTTTITESTTVDVEKIPDELTMENGSMPDVLFADAEATTGNTHTEYFKTSLSQNATV